MTQIAEKPSRIDGMARSFDQWLNMVPHAVADGSKAQVEYALADASHDIEVLWRKVTSQAAEIERLRDTLTDAEKYLRHLLISFVREHFPDNTSWRPLDGDLIGMLTQMDNACTIARDYKDQLDAKDKALEPFAKVATVFDHQRLPAPCEDHHTVYTWATKATGEVEITVADFRAAHAALTTGAAHE